MRIASLIIAGLAFHLTGCVHLKRTEREMPIGIFDPPASALPDLAGTGFNLIVAPASDEILDAAQRSNMSVLMTGGRELMLKPAKQAHLRMLDRHPAAWGWYLWDEPDLHQVSPRRVRVEERRLKQFVAKPTTVVLSSGGSVEKYVGTADALAVDWYPVPWSSVGTVAREMRLARLGADRREFLAILQAFDWTIASNLLETTVPLRAPTREELRCMTYLALMQGASGIIFYAYTASGWNLETNSALHRAVLEIGSEIRANESMFSDRVRWWPAQTETHGPPERMFNEIGDARISLALFRAKKPDARYYLFAANTTAEPTDFSFKLPFKNVEKLPTSCATDDFQAERGWIRKTYGPYEVCIFGPIHGPIADE
jgi:hypothetical protein